jgi:hypothetical protein
VICFKEPKKLAKCVGRRVCVSDRGAKRIPSIMTLVSADPPNGGKAGDRKYVRFQPSHRSQAVVYTALIFTLSTYRVIQYCLYNYYDKLLN